MAGFGDFLTYFISLPQEEEKIKRMLNTLNILLNVQIICNIYQDTLP